MMAAVIPYGSGSPALPRAWRGLPVIRARVPRIGRPLRWT